MYQNDPITNFLKTSNIYFKKDKYNLLEADTSINTVENTAESLKYFLPYFFNKIRGSFQLMFPALSKKDLNETQLIQSICKNVTITVYENTHPMPNAYTIPALSGKIKSTALALIAEYLPFTTFIYALAALEHLYDFDAELKSKNNIVFNNPKKVEVSLFVTRGLKGMLTEEEKLAIMLHEIGHWVNFYPVFQNILYANLGAIFPPLVFLFVVLSIIKARTAEYKADAFAAKLGYGDELISALDKMSFKRRSNISILGKIDDILRVITMRIDSLLDYILPISNHPNFKKRKDNIEKNKNLEEVFDYFGEQSLILAESYFLLDEGAKDLFVKTLAKVLSPLDKFLAKNVELLFPLYK